jgi:Ca2+/Na+ antiporter
LAVSVKAALADQADLSIGNVVGRQHLLHILFILAFQRRLPVAGRSICFAGCAAHDWITALFAVLALDLRLGRVEG